MKIIETLKILRSWYKSSFPTRSKFGYCASNVQIHYPFRADTPQNIFLYDNTMFREVRIINSPNEKVIIKKYSVITSNVIIIPNNHLSTVGLPQILLGSSHINDKSSDIIIEEDCWVGSGAIILAGSHLGRGCIVGAGAIVNKEIPPYAVVVGCPAKIVAVKFSIEQIIEHEKALYAAHERFSREYLDNLFSKFYEGKKVYGINTERTPEEIIKLNQIKKRMKFVES